MSGSYYVDSSNRGNVNELLDQAELYRDQALQYSNEAGASAADAASSETNASTSASNAATSASNASASATASEASAVASSSSANMSLGYSNSAATSASDANNYKNQAATSASNAATSASQAATSATDAANSASQATVVLSTSLLKANNLSDLQNISVAKTNLGLGNVNNTSDANKPISTAQAAGLVAKDSNTGSAQLPAGTTAQRSPNGAGKLRYNTELSRPEVNNGTTWDLLGGDIVGPSSATDNALVRFNSTTGKLVKNSSATLNDSGGLSVSALQVGQSGTPSNNFRWRNLLDGLISLSRGNIGDPSPVDVIRVKVDNSVEFPGGVASGVLGAGQTWQDVKGSRASATNYTNSTGNPILVVVSAGSTPGLAAASISVSGVVVASMADGYNAATNIIPLVAVVPNGATYRVDVTQGVIQNWTELR